MMMSMLDIIAIGTLYQLQQQCQNLLSGSFICIKYWITQSYASIYADASANVKDICTTSTTLNIIFSTSNYEFKE